MKRNFLFLVVGFLLAVSFTASAEVITDNYWGAKPTNNYTNQDIIGHDYQFDISKMEVTFDNGNMIVDINTRYLDNIGALNTGLGDLFISTNGWNPYGTGNYKEDKASNGEKWEFALVMNNRPSDNDGAKSGTASLYAITPNSQIFLSDYYFANTGYIYRSGQEVSLNTTGLEPIQNVTTAEWSFNYGETDADTDDFLRFIIGYDFGNVDEFGFHYTFTCGNDVIEGAVAAPVPEPATMLLLGSGLIGLAGFGRKKLLK